MIISTTGHRPNGLPKEYGYNLNNEAWTKLKEYIEATIEECYKYATPNEELTLVTGMALGVDTAFWEVAAKLRKNNPNIRIEAALPFIGQEKKWTEESQKQYKQMLSESDKVTIVSEGGFAKYKMMARNRYMVNKSDIVIAVICKETGGTAQCVKYAKEHNKVVIEINPQNIL